MTIPAEVSFGRSELVTLSSTQDDRPGSDTAAIASTGAEPPVPAASTLEVRIVTTFTESTLFTVCIALPAKIGRSKVSESTIRVTSETIITSRRAATRGRMFLASLVAGATIWL